MSSIGYIDQEHVGKVESITGDNTIGVVHYDLDEPEDHDIVVDIQRLRRLLIAYEEEIGGDAHPRVSIRELEFEDGGSSTVLALRSSESEGAAREAVLAEVVSAGGGDDQ